MKNCRQCKEHEDYAESVGFFIAQLIDNECGTDYHEQMAMERAQAGKPANWRYTGHKIAEIVMGLQIENTTLKREMNTSLYELRARLAQADYIIECRRKYCVGMNEMHGMTSCNQCHVYSTCITTRYQQPYQQAQQGQEGEE